MPQLANTQFFNDASLISYWKFEGNSNDSKDSNNGSDTSISYSIANGKFDQGAGLNGTTSEISLGNPANLKITGNFTLSIWIKTSADGSVFEIWSWDGTKRAGINLTVNGSLSIESAKNTGNIQGTDYQAASGGTVKDGIWHHCVGTWDGSNLTLYLDGNQVAQTAWAQAPAYQTENFHFGVRFFAGALNNYWAGSMDDAAVFSRALSLNEIRLIYINQGCLDGEI